MHETATYHCINPDCARAMPRRVAFCPYCGTAQAAVPASAAAASAAAASVRREPAPPPVAQPAAAPMPAPAPAPTPTPAPTPAPPPSATGFGRSGAAPGPAAAARPEAVPPGPPRTLWGRGPAGGPVAPSGRQPVRLRWWLLVLAALAALWWWAKSPGRRVEQRIGHAIELARACKARDAQDELIALRRDRATAQQLARLQEALNDEAAECTRRRQREKAWRDTSEAVETVLASPSSASLDRARTRLQVYTRRWGEDERSRALLERIEAERHPLAAPNAN